MNIAPTLPTFPTFTYITGNNKAEIEEYTKKYPHYSDYNFVSLFGWDTGGERMVSKLNGNLVVKFTDYTTHAPFLSFIGVHAVDATACTLIEYARSTGMEPELKLIPEVTARLILSPDISITEDRANFDYVYRCADIAQLDTPRSKKIRSQVNRFTRENPDALCEITTRLNATMLDDVIATIAVWEARKRAAQHPDIPTHEQAAIRRLFEQLQDHRILFTGVFIHKKLLAFSIDEILGDYGMGHFCKADVGHRGIYDFMNTSIASHFETLGVTHWNWQQDLGIESLRRSKQKIRIDHFLKKYILSLRTI